MAEKRALGKGLSALIPEGTKAREEVTSLKISEIIPSKFQPREDFDPHRLNELISSIKEKGVIQPILVRPNKERDGYELIAGERRLRAAKALGLDEIPVIVKNVNDTELLEMSLIENIQRENLNSIEQAHAYEKLMKEFNLSQEEIAKAVGKDRTTITNTLRLLNLPAFVQKCICEGKINFGHAKALLSLSTIAKQIDFCKKIIKENISVRHAESLVATVPGTRKKNWVTRDPNIVALEENLQRRFGTRVRITAGKKRGAIKIEFYSPNDMNRVLKLLGA